MKTQIFFTILITVLNVSAFATEFPADRSRIGFFSFGAGHLPKPGTNTLISGYIYNDWDRLTDSENNRRVNFEQIDSEARGATLGYLRVTNKKIMGADYAFGLMLPYMNVSVDHTINTPYGTQPIKGKHDGLVGLFTTPVILEWRQPEKQLFQNARINLGIPIGHFDEDNPANVIRDYYSAELVYQATYNIKPDWEFSAGVSYQYNFRNQHELHPTVSGPQGKYKNGDSFAFNAAVGKKYGNLTVGLTGYLIEQLTEDQISDASDFNGFKQRAFGIGPTVAYRFTSLKNTPILHTKFSKGIYSEDAVTGDFFSLFLTYPF